MIIECPAIRNSGGYSFLTSLITDEVTGVTKEIYFSVPDEYGQYLAAEVADPFVIAMLLPAVVSGQDLTVKGPVSDRLYFQTGNALIYLFSKMFKKKPVTIHALSTTDPDFRPSAVATGFSGGVDSFYTVLQHTAPACPGSLRLTHLTLFNVGAYGNTEQTSEAFYRDSERAAHVARQLNLPLVLLNSNISTMHNHPDIFPFSTRVSSNIMAGVLALPKLFKTYLFSSGVPADYTKFDPAFRDQGWYDVLLAHYLSGSNTQILISGSSVMRLDRLRFIAGKADNISLWAANGHAQNDSSSPDNNPLQASPDNIAPTKTNGSSRRTAEYNPSDATTAAPAAIDLPSGGISPAGINYRLVQKNLYVCQADVYNEKYASGFKKDTSPNCSECDKCTRTLISLELMGCLSDFSSQFDLQKWQRAKYKRLAIDLAKYDTDPFAREILDLAKAQNYPLPLKSKLIASKMRLRKKLKNVQLLRRIYHLVKRG